VHTFGLFLELLLLNTELNYEHVIIFVRNTTYERHSSIKMESILGLGF